MAFAEIVGQSDAAERFLNTLRSSRMAHAYIVCGPRGVGKSAFAHEMAKAILCRTPAPTAEACGHCNSCLKCDHDTHPELATLERLAGRQNILVEQVEALREEWFSLRPVESDRKVCLVLEADRMNEEVANRLLKILEEPSGDTVFILTTARLEALLETIVSRCQILRLRQVPEDEIAEALRRRHPTAPASAIRLAARLSGGSPGRAEELLDEDVLQRAQWAVTLVNSVRPDSVAQVMGELMGYVGRKGRERLEDARQRLTVIMESLVLHWKDILMGLALGEPPGARGVVPEHAQRPAWQVEAFLDAALEAETRLLANVNLTALVQAMLARMARAQATESGCSPSNR